MMSSTFMPRIFSAERKTQPFLLLLTRRSTATLNSATFQENQENAKPFDSLPKVPSVPIFKSMWTYIPFLGRHSRSKLHVADMNEYEKYGKIFRKDIGRGKECVVLYDPKDIEKMFRYEGKYPERSMFAAMDAYRFSKKKHFGTGLIASIGPEWKSLRTTLQKYLMNQKLVTSYLPALNEVADDAVKNIESLRNSDGEVVNIVPQLDKFALEAISLVIFDQRLGCFHPNLEPSSTQLRMFKEMWKVFTAINNMEYSLGLWKYFPTKSWRELCSAMDFFTDYIIKRIDEVKKNAGKGDRELILLEILLLKENLSDEDAAGYIFDMLLAGIDTTSNIVAYTLYLFARHQEIQEKAYQEILKHHPNSQDPVTVDVLEEMKFLKACLKESMRIYPVLQRNLRTLHQDIVLSGYKIPAGTKLISNSLAVCWLDEYFPNPKMFQPERWLGKNKENIPPFSYLPFGFGPRMCIAKRITEQEMWTFLIKVLHKFSVEYHHEDIDMFTNVVNTPDRPLNLKFVLRN